MEATGPQKVSARKQAQKEKTVTLDARQVLALKDYINALEKCVIGMKPTSHDEINKLSRVHLELGLNWQKIYEFSHEAHAIGSLYSQRFGYTKTKTH